MPRNMRQFHDFISTPQRPFSCLCAHWGKSTHIHNFLFPFSLQYTVAGCMIFTWAKNSSLCEKTMGIDFAVSIKLLGIACCTFCLERCAQWVVHKEGIKITIREQNTGHIYGEKVACLRCGAARVTNNGTPADSYQTNLLPEMMWSDIPQPTRSRTAISSLFVLVKTQQINLHQQQKIWDAHACKSSPWWRIDSQVVS